MTGSSATIPPRRVLVVQTALVGDVVFTSPLIHAIKEKYPKAWLTLVVRLSNLEVARCIPGVDEVLAFDERGNETGVLGILRAAKKIRQCGFDLLISLHRSPRTALFSLLSRVPLRVGYRQGFGRFSYQVGIAPVKGEPCILAQNLKLVGEVGIQPAGMRLRLKSPADKASYVREFCQADPLLGCGKWAALCVGSLWPTKCWPPVYFASLASTLRERGYQPILFGGPQESGVGEDIRRVLGAPIQSCIGNSLGEAAALLEKCAVAVGGDSGLTHMARALSVPTVIIYGPTDQRVHVFGDGVRVLCAKVKCRPCSRHGQLRCPEGHHDCMRLVSPEQVLEALRDLVNLQTPVPQVAHPGRTDRDETQLPLG